MKTLLLALLLTCTSLHATVVTTAANGTVGNAILLQGRAIAPTAPTDTYVLKWNAAGSLWAPAASGGAVDAANGGADDPLQISNCSIGVTVAASAATFTLLDGAGSALSAASPCIISFRNATAATGTYAKVTTTSAVTFVIPNHGAAGCPTAAAQCILQVYAINNAGTVVLGVIVGGDLDEGSVQTSTTVDDPPYTLYSTAGQSSKAVRKLARVTITPAASFSWTNSVTEISNATAVKSPWYINSYMSGANPAMSTGSVGSYTEITSSTFTLTPVSGSAPVGTVCATTNAATAPQVSATTCAAGNEGMGLSFAVPSAGVYEVCMQGEFDIVAGIGVVTNTSFELIETPTNAQTLTLEAGPVTMATLTGAVAADQLGVPLHLCGIFNWNKKAAGTVVAVRLMYQSSNAGTPDNVRFMCDAAVGRVCAFTAKRL